LKAFYYVEKVFLKPFLLLSLCCFFITGSSLSQQRQTISYHGLPVVSLTDTLKNSRINIWLDIYQNSTRDTSLYSELHTVHTDSSGRYRLEIGRGRGPHADFDSIIWAVGTYYLRMQFETLSGKKLIPEKTVILTSPVNLENDYVQGVDSAKGENVYGELTFKNSRQKRPRKVVVDLTTSYVNVRYPADQYPIYRHFEWNDRDADGKGDSFTISFSENTNNAFEESTSRLGEVKLYAYPFQELNISSGPDKIVLSLTKPVALTSHGQTYMIKGPWSIIYYFEW
jgi:hypothetical protein